MNKKILICYCEILGKGILIFTFSMIVIYGSKYILESNGYVFSIYIRLFLGVLMLSLVLTFMLPGIRRLEKFVVEDRHQKEQKK